MMTKIKAGMTAVFGVVLVAGLGMPSRAVGADVAAPADAITVLDNNSMWSIFKIFKYADVRTTDGTLESRIVGRGQNGLHNAKAPSADWSALPPADYTAPEFDDVLWPHGKTPWQVSWKWSAYEQALVILRGKFEVTDPTQVKDLRLSLNYYGGVVAYLNGKEVARGHVAGDKPALKAIAEDYPLEAFTTAAGRPLGIHDDADPKNRDRLALRERKLTNITIPVAVLRKGVNVLTLEIHRAPVPEIIGGKGEKQFDVRPGDAFWAPIGLPAVTLIASPAGAVVANARPKGIQVWNCAPWATVSIFDFGAPESLRPINLIAPRNGIFSGRLMAGSDRSIKGLKVAVSDLVSTNGGGKLPASIVQVRYAQPTMPEAKIDLYTPQDHFDGLLDVIPAEIPVSTIKPSEEQRGQIPGALAPIWLSMHVPSDAKPGQYQGTVTVSAEGLNATTVPLHMTVYDWALPDPQDYRTSVCGYCLPESVANYYHVPLWSDRHFALMGQTLALMAGLNSRQVLVNLSIDWYGHDYAGGNQETEVRWIKQADGTFKHDFSVFDKHLEAIAKSIGKPRPIRLNCWVGESKSFAVNGWWADPKFKDKYAPKVTTLDPATGKLGTMEQPCPGTPESLVFWKPVLDEIRKKVEARGWWDVTCLGYSHPYGGMDPCFADVAKQIWPDGIWATTSHGGALGSFSCTDGSKMPVRYAEGHWSVPSPAARGWRALLDPKRSAGRWYATRNYLPTNYSPLTDVRCAQEYDIMRTTDGGQMGADIFPLKSANGHYNFEDHNRGDLGPIANGTVAILAPGPNGPVPTERYEMFREGIEICEAIMFLEKALSDKKLDGNLAQRVTRFLDDRCARNIRYWTNGTFDQDETLLALAAEAAAKLAGK